MTDCNELFNLKPNPVSKDGVYGSLGFERYKENGKLSWPKKLECSNKLDKPEKFKSFDDERYSQVWDYFYEKSHHYSILSNVIMEALNRKAISVDEALVFVDNNWKKLHGINVKRYSVKDRRKNKNKWNKIFKENLKYKEMFEIYESKLKNVGRDMYWLKSGNIIWTERVRIDKKKCGKEKWYRFITTWGNYEKFIRWEIRELSRRNKSTLVDVDGRCILRNFLSLGI